MVTRKRKIFKVRPSIPQKLKPLEEIAKNYWWCWHSQAIELFQSISIDLWRASKHNPYLMLGQLEPADFEKLEADESFMLKMQSVYIDLQEYLSQTTFYRKEYGTKSNEKIVYFSAEFGIHESFPNYSGGLGILAGDHLKSASDVGLPLVAMGLMYKRGYFVQYLNEDGWQQEEYPVLDFYNLPMDLVNDDKGNPIVVEVDFPGRKVYAQIWQVNVGRVRLFLLDTNIPINSEVDRNITDILYGGDTEHRIQQEIVLGVGGMRALKRMGIEPTVVHMNEGHSAFSGLERIRESITEKKLSYAEARELVKATTAFTTHTPVPAGNEVFPDHLISKYLEPYIKAFGIPLEQFLDLGRIHQGRPGDPFGMTVFSLRIAFAANGVSRLHGEVSRKMWKDIWENLEHQEVPIGYITNGIHLPSWISDEMSRLYRRYIGPDWYTKSDNPETWKRVEQIPEAELWKAQERLKEQLVGYVRKKVKRSLRDSHAAPQDVHDADNLLDPEALTIGFARRFATYKRATLLFKDKERLKRILANKKMPVQFVFAGKAHPRDMEGKKLIKEIVHFSREAGVKNKIIFLENYDIQMARYLVQGVDVWLNNPRRPHEASGTSGMKVPVNGGLNLSIPDGWWAEAYNSDIGWAIGAGEDYSDYEYQDYVESRVLYDILEKSVIPLYYDRSADNIPRKWLVMMKQSIMQCSPQFNTDRQVKQYQSKYYTLGTKNYHKFAEPDFKTLKEYMGWINKFRESFKNVRVESFDVKEESDIPSVGHQLVIEAQVNLAGLKNEDVQVDLVYAPECEGDETCESPTVLHMAFDREENGKFIFKTSLVPKKAGGYQYMVRVLPYHPNIPRQLEPGLIRWAE